MVGLRNFLSMIATHYSEVSGALFCAFLLIAWFFLRPKDPELQVKVRKYDPHPPRGKKSSAAQSDPIGDAKASKKEPLQLSGFRESALPHEILDIPATASVEQIHEAYRAKMKQYHPDRVGRPGSREWTDAQKIAESLNQAREAMLKKKKPVP